MTLPDITDLEGKCAILETVAKSYPEGSSEREAINTAVHAMHYVAAVETQAKFQSWVNSWIQPPTALQILNAKLAGIEDIPHELLNDTLREVEQLMERLRQKRN